MTLVERRIFRINDFVDNINPAQICVEPMEDPDLDFRMYCGTDILGNATKWLAKDQKARITDLSITDRLNMNANDVVNVGSLYAPWTDLDNDTWARLRFYYNGAYPTSEFVQARPGLECGVRLDATQSKAHFFCDTNRGLFFNGPEMILKDYDSDTSKYNFLLTSDGSGTSIESDVGLFVGSAGSLSLFDANILSCEDWDTDTVLLSATEQEIQNCFDIFGVSSIFAMIYGAVNLGGKGLDEAYRYNISQYSNRILVNEGPVYFTQPSTTETASTILSINNLKAGNLSPLLNLYSVTEWAAEEHPISIQFSGATGANVSGVLGERFFGNRIWSLDGTVSIGRDYNLSTDYSSQVFARFRRYVTNPETHQVQAQLVSRDTWEGLSSAELTLTTWYTPGDPEAVFSTAKLAATNNVNLISSGGTITLLDKWRVDSTYTGGSIPLSVSQAEWTAFAAIAGVSGSLLGGIIAAAASTPTPNSLILKTGAGATENTNLYTFNGSAAKTLELAAGSNVSITATANKWTIAATNTTYSAGTGLSLSTTTFNHSNSVTAQATQALYPIKIDAQGHISEYGTAITTLPNANALTLKIKSGTSEGINLYTYDGSAAKTLDIEQGSNITLTEHPGSLTIAATNTTYPLTQGYVAYGNGTGITGEDGLFWDSTNKRLGIGTTEPTVPLHIVGNSGDVRVEEYSTSSSPSIIIARSYSNTIGNYIALPGNLSYAGGLTMEGSDGTGWKTGVMVGWRPSGNWANDATRNGDLLIRTTHENTLGIRMRLHSEGGITYGTDGDATRDWQKGHFLASQRLDGSTAGSSQSIVAMTLGLRTTSTTANQVLKLTSSDSGSPLVLEAGFLYSFIVKVTACFESGDHKNFNSWTYDVYSYYSETWKELIKERISGTTMGSVNITHNGSGVLEIRYTPPAECSVDNPINVMATIGLGTKQKVYGNNLCGVG